MEGLWDYSPQWNVNGSDVCHFWVQAFKEVHVLFAFSFPFCQLDARNSNNLGWGSATWAQGLSMKFYWNTATLIRLHMAYSSFSATTRSWVDCNRNRAINLKYLLCVCVCVFRHVRLFATPWTTACQFPLSMGFSRQEYWSGLPFPPPGHLPDLGIEPASLTSTWLQVDS